MDVTLLPKIKLCLNHVNDQVKEQLLYYAQIALRELEYIEDKNKRQKFEDLVVQGYKRAIAVCGNMVGPIATQSVTRGIIQSSISAFHSAGESGNATASESGTRLTNLFNVSKTPKTTQITLHFGKYHTHDDIIKMQSRIKDIKIKNILSSKTAEVIKIKTEWWHKVKFILSGRKYKEKYIVIRLYLSKFNLIMYKISPDEIVDKLTSSGNCIICQSPLDLCYIDIVPISVERSETFMYGHNENFLYLLLPNVLETRLRGVNGCGSFIPQFLEIFNSIAYKKEIPEGRDILIKIDRKNSLYNGIDRELVMGLVMKMGFECETTVSSEFEFFIKNVGSEYLNEKFTTSLFNLEQKDSDVQGEILLDIEVGRVIKILQNLGYKNTEQIRSNNNNTFYTKNTTIEKIKESFNKLFKYNNGIIISDKKVNLEFIFDVLHKIGFDCYISNDILKINSVLIYRLNDTYNTFKKDYNNKSHIYYFYAKVPIRQKDEKDNEKSSITVNGKQKNSVYEFFLLENNIDHTRFFSTDPRTMYELYGIEIARAYMINMIVELLAKDGDLSIDIRHIETVVDWMTSEGKLDSVTYAGVSKKKNGSPLNTSSYEKPLSTIVNAGSMGFCEPVSTVSASIISGQKPRIGHYSTYCKMEFSPMANIYTAFNKNKRTKTTPETKDDVNDVTETIVETEILEESDEDDITLTKDKFDINTDQNDEEKAEKLPQPSKSKIEYSFPSVNELEKVSMEPIKLAKIDISSFMKTFGVK